jgi:hypothetical protein
MKTFAGSSFTDEPVPKPIDCALHAHGFGTTSGDYELSLETGKNNPPE